MAIKPIHIALDAMGGDDAPDIVIKGAARALKRYPSVRYTIFGDKAIINPMIDALPELAEASTIRHTDQKVSAEGSVKQALRQRDTSMRLAVEAVKNKEADAVVSAGSTGALMGISYLLLKTLPGIERPAIASFFPTLRGEACMLDLGANVQCSARNLVEFAIMGNVFASLALGVKYPSYGLLNIGTEASKGLDYIKDAAQKIQDINERAGPDGGIPGKYVGYVEGDAVTAGNVDVIVTDGFTGNVALKMGEGTAKLTTEYIRRTFRASLMAKIGYVFAARTFRKLRLRLDPRRYNGAILLGLNGVSVKSHGGTDEIGFANAIGVAVDLVEGKVQESISQELAKLAPVLQSEA
ncbi:MAG: phosphate acyltransferase PlsX [Alphaproteobacteria bacterium]